MSKFKVDLNASDRPERFTDEGNYVVTIEKVERQHTAKGDEKAVITLKDDRNRSVDDSLLNKDSVYWRLNQLVVSSGMKVPHGTEYDFSKSGEFFNFVKSFIGLKVGITLKKESYIAKDGAEKFVLKVAKFNKADATTADSPF
jgi:hypothetical protein